MCGEAVQEHLERVPRAKAECSGLWEGRKIFVQQDVSGSFFQDVLIVASKQKGCITPSHAGNSWVMLAASISFSVLCVYTKQGFASIWRECMVNAYGNMLLLAVIAAGFSGAFLLLSRFVGPHKPEPVKASNFECGLPVQGSVLGKFSIKFYLVVILFLLFDLEVVFFYPWAVQDQAGVGVIFWLVEGLLFAVILLVGWVYVIKQRVLEWGARAETTAAKNHKST